MKKYLFIIIFLSLIALWPFFKKGYFETHDGDWMIIRFTAFHQTLATGQFPVRFVDRLNNNYGYPVANFLYPLPFYLAEIPKVLGSSFVDSIKLIFIFSSVASVVAMFWALSLVFGRQASFAGALLYLFVPYRFVDLYVRGSIGENLAFLFVPLILGCIFKIAKSEEKFVPLLAIFTACLILSHNVIAVLFLPFLMICAYLLIEKDKIKVFSGFMLGLAIASFFWIPAIYDLQFVRLSQIKVANIADHLVSPASLIIPSWGFGPNPNGQNALPVQIGIVPILIFAAAVYVFLKNKVKESVIIFTFLVILGATFLMTNFSLPLWQTIPKIDTIQFPWRLLSLIVFATSFLAAYVINFFPKNKLLVPILTVAAICSTIPYTRPQAFIEKPDSYYSTNEDSTTVQDEYLPLWVKEKPQKRADQIFELQGKGEIMIAIPTFTDYRAHFTANEKIEVKFNKIFFPGWQVKTNGHTIPINYQNQHGLITFNLPQGQHEVIIKYEKSPVHLFAEIVSLVAILITGVYFLKLWQKRNS